MPAWIRGRGGVAVSEEAKTPGPLVSALVAGRCAVASGMAVAESKTPDAFVFSGFVAESKTPDAVVSDDPFVSAAGAAMAARSGISVAAKGGVGTRKIFPQAGHIASRPASRTGSDKLLWQRRQVTFIDMRAQSLGCRSDFQTDRRHFILSSGQKQRGGDEIGNADRAECEGVEPA